MGQNSCCTKDPHLLAETAQEVIRSQPSTIRTQRRYLVIVVGPPGCGKSTVIPIIIQKLGLRHLPMTELLRHALISGSKLGMKSKTIIDSGGNLPDDVFIELLLDRITDSDCSAGVILDDFPVTLDQAERLETMLDTSGEFTKLVLSLVAPDDVLVDRICNRWVHMPSGRTYSTQGKRPKSLGKNEEAHWDNMLDDITGDTLVKEHTDTEEGYNTRLGAYKSCIVPVVDFYEQLGYVRRIDANTDIDSMLESVGKVVSGRNIVVLFGPPGCGKGTHAPKIVEKLGIPHLVVGDVLRDAARLGTNSGKKAQEVVQKGGDISDDIISGTIKERIQYADCAPGFLLDGFPRNMQQAKALDSMLSRCGESVSMVLSFEVPDSALSYRISGRWVHKASGRSYHVATKRPKSFASGGVPSVHNMFDDDTGEPLMRRADDSILLHAKRLEAYHEVTAPILAHYKPRGCVRTVDAHRDINSIWQSINAEISGRNIVLLFGPPGCGKEVQAPRLKHSFGTTHLVAGDLIMQAVAAGTDLGKKAKAVMERTTLVPDELVISIIKDRIQQADCSIGFLLDNFPQTVDQAKKFDAMLATIGETVKMVLALVVPDSVLLARIGDIKKKSSDAGADPLAAHIQDYLSQTVPTLRYYEPTGRVKKVDANRDEDSIWQSINAVMLEKRYVVILFGAPCSGKRTYINQIMSKLGTPRISVDDLLITYLDFPDSKPQKVSWQPREKISDEDLMGIIRERIRQPDCAAGFLMIDFPRTKKQAEMLDAMLATQREKVNTVLSLTAAESVLIARACGRWVHKSSGRSYHIPQRMPKSLPVGVPPTSSNMFDDETGEALVRLSGDTVPGVTERLKGYVAEVVPVLMHYEASKCVTEIDTGRDMASVWKSIQAAL